MRSRSSSIDFSCKESFCSVGNRKNSPLNRNAIPPAIKDIPSVSITSPKGINLARPAHVAKGRPLADIS